MLGEARLSYLPKYNQKKLSRLSHNSDTSLHLSNDYDTFLKSIDCMTMIIPSNHPTNETLSLNHKINVTFSFP